MVISTIIVSRDEWETGVWTVLPIKDEIERNARGGVTDDHIKKDVISTGSFGAFLGVNKASLRQTT